LEPLAGPQCPTDIPPTVGQPGYTDWHPSFVGDTALKITIPIPGTKCFIQANGCWRILNNGAGPLQIFIRKLTVVGGGVPGPIDDPSCIALWNKYINYEDDFFVGNSNSPYNKFMWDAINQLFLQYKVSVSAVNSHEDKFFLDYPPICGSGTKKLEVYFLVRCYGTGKKTSDNLNVTIECSNSIDYCKMSCDICLIPGGISVKKSNCRYEFLKGTGNDPNACQSLPLKNPSTFVPGSISCRSRTCQPPTTAGISVLVGNPYIDKSIKV
jgi:hypothetical protein